MVCAYRYCLLASKADCDTLARNMANPPILRTAILIAGPTASGKSDLALKLARERGGVIINADAMQVYRELRILTARPDESQLMQAPHSLYGHISGRQAFSVAQWQREAVEPIEQAWQNQAVPIFVGGTGLYFKALEEGLADMPEIPVEVRERWRNFAGDIHNELALRDPGGAKRFNRNDRQRISRALEVIDATGQSIQSWQELAKSTAVLKNATIERHLVSLPREDLYARAEARFDRMMQEGALAEVQAIRDYNDDLPMMKAIGVPELRAYLKGETPLDAAIANAKTATRNYIKRQLTWWRGQGGHWAGA
jgi:tRNA dimethylallyltransferase